MYSNFHNVPLHYCPFLVLSLHTSSTEPAFLLCRYSGVFFFFRGFYGCEGAEIITPKASWKKRAVFPVPTVCGVVGHVTRLHPDGTPCEVSEGCPLSSVSSAS